MPTGAGGKVLTGRRLSSADSYFFFKFICSWQTQWLIANNFCQRKEANENLAARTKSWGWGKTGTAIPRSLPSRHPFICFCNDCFFKKWNWYAAIFTVVIFHTKMWNCRMLKCWTVEGLLLSAKYHFPNDCFGGTEAQSLFLRTKRTWDFLMFHLLSYHIHGHSVY
jgi:hypothetical protein